MRRISKLIRLTGNRPTGESTGHITWNPTRAVNGLETHIGGRASTRRRGQVSTPVRIIAGCMGMRVLEPVRREVSSGVMGTTLLEILDGLRRFSASWVLAENG